MTDQSREQWAASIQRNGEMIAAALDEARAAMHEDDDAGNALAFAVAIAIPPEGMDDFIESLRTFSNARKALTN